MYLFQIHSQLTILFGKCELSRVGSGSSFRNDKSAPAPVFDADERPTAKIIEKRGMQGPLQRLQFATSNLHTLLYLLFHLHQYVPEGHSVRRQTCSPSCSCREFIRILQYDCLLTSRIPQNKSPNQYSPIHELLKRNYYHLLK